MPGTPVPVQATREPLVKYATAIATATGLSLAAVLAWIRAEGGLSSAGAPHNNFLNLMIPGTQTPERYGTPAEGAAAVVRNLRTPLYAHVLATAHATDDPKVELQAIAQSRWDAGHYTGGLNVPWGTTLLGALSANASDPANAGDALASGTGQGGAGGSDLGLHIPNPLTAWVGDLTGWFQKEASLGLAYLVLTVLGVAFVLFGALDTLGYAPGRVAGAAIARRPGRAVSTTPSFWEDV